MNILTVLLATLFITHNAYIIPVDQADHPKKETPRLHTNRPGIYIPAPYVDSSGRLIRNPAILELVGWENVIAEYEKQKKAATNGRIKTSDGYALPVHSQTMPIATSYVITSWKGPVWICPSHLSPLKEEIDKRKQ